MCYELCRKLNYRFFGVQYSTHCFCGNHYGRYGIRPNTECRMQCSGDKTTYCGAGWRNSVYTTGVERARKADGVHYLGCFVDNGNRDLPFYRNFGPLNTKEYCWAFCRKAGYKYFGMQYSSYCFCGNTFGRYGRGAQNTCYMSCTGDRRTKCGGPWRNQIYTTGLASKPEQGTPGMVHLGCFVDSGARDLPKLASASGMTVGRCYSLCKNLGFEFFGVQAGTHCFCGDHYGRYGRRDKRECRSQCAGDKTTYCGGGWRNDIFTTGVGVKVKGSSYLGCFIDNGSRDLPVVVHVGHQATGPFCIKYCKRAGYKFAGTQYSSYCTCGNRYGAFGKVSNAQCNMACSGDKREKCGGPWRNSIFRTGLATKKSTTPGMKFIGCLIDSSTRDLPHIAGTTDMSIPKCYKLCRNLNYKFFGVQYSTHCFCGNHYGRYGIRPNTECRMQCSGDKTTYCGAGWRNSVFTTGIEVASERDGVKRLGCFVDTAQRDLPVVHNAGFETDKAFCWKFCREKGFVYFGLQNGDHCTCGNSYGAFGRASEDSCRTPCRGDKTSQCGGSYRNAIFTTGVLSAPLTAPGMKHIGCFADTSSRDLPHLAASNGEMSVLSCRLKCKKLGYKYFGVQFAKECWCGNTYGRHGRKSQMECRMQCTGDKTSYCGSNWRNDIYTTGIELEAATCPSGHKEQLIPERTCSCKHAGTHSLGSLVFVIDVTGSMGRVIQSVKENIRRILAANRRFDDFVIATFGDPYVKQLKKTTSVWKITTFLNKLKASGGGDCPEFALSGALDAAEAAEPNSVMVLFTDASAKDKHKLSTVEAKLKAKRIRFFTVASGNLCGTSGHEFSHLASATFGQLSKLSSRTSNKVMELIRRGASGDLSFSAFPRDTSGLDDVLRGKCACRTIQRRICVKPHTGFQGCYKDEDIAPELAVALVSNDMTVWKCNDICKARKQPYFGLKNGKICGCGDQYGNSGDADISLCNTACSGSAGEKCGGSVYNAVFEVK